MSIVPFQEVLDIFVKNYFLVEDGSRVPYVREVHSLTGFILASATEDMDAGRVSHGSITGNPSPYAIISFIGPTTEGDYLIVTPWGFWDSDNDFYLLGDEGINISTYVSWPGEIGVGTPTYSKPIIPSIFDTFWEYDEFTEEFRFSLVESGNSKGTGRITSGSRILVGNSPIALEQNGVADIRGYDYLYDPTLERIKNLEECIEPPRIVFVLTPASDGTTYHEDMDLEYAGDGLKYNALVYDALPYRTWADYSHQHRYGDIIVQEYTIIVDPYVDVNHVTRTHISLDASGNVVQVNVDDRGIQYVFIGNPNNCRIDSQDNPYIRKYLIATPMTQGRYAAHYPYEGFIPVEYDTSTENLGYIANGASGSKFTLIKKVIDFPEYRSSFPIPPTMDLAAMAKAKREAFPDSQGIVITESLPPPQYWICDANPIMSSIQPYGSAGAICRTDILSHLTTMGTGRILPDFSPKKVSLKAYILFDALPLDIWLAQVLVRAPYGTIYLFEYKNPLTSEVVWRKTYNPIPAEGSAVIQVPIFQDYGAPTIYATTPDCLEGYYDLEPISLPEVLLYQEGDPAIPCTFVWDPDHCKGVWDPTDTTTPGSPYYVPLPTPFTPEEFQPDPLPPYTPDSEFDPSISGYFRNPNDPRTIVSAGQLPYMFEYDATGGDILLSEDGDELTSEDNITILQ